MSPVEKRLRKALQDCVRELNDWLRSDLAPDGSTEIEVRETIANAEKALSKRGKNDRT